MSYRHVESTISILVEDFVTLSVNYGRGNVILELDSRGQDQVKISRDSG